MKKICLSRKGGKSIGITSRNAASGYNTPVTVDTEALSSGVHYIGAENDTAAIKDTVNLGNLNAVSLLSDF